MGATGRGRQWSHVLPTAVRCEGCGRRLPGWRALYASWQGLLLQSQERRTCEQYGPISTPPTPTTWAGWRVTPFHGRQEAEMSPTLTSRWVAPHQPAVESEITSSNYGRIWKLFCASDISSSPGVNQPSAVLRWGQGVGHRACGALENCFSSSIIAH